MGYAGYFSTTNLIKDKLTDVEQALRAIKNLETLEIIGKLVKNIATQPGEDKYRRIKLSNPKINATIVQQEGGVVALHALGFAPVDDDTETLEVAKGKITAKEVRTVEDTKDWLKKELRTMSRSSSKSSLKENDNDAAKAALRAQLEADRKERAAQGPVTLGSKAQPLPSSGANVMSASAAGAAGNQ